MSWQYAIVAVVVALSAATVARAILRAVRAKSCAHGGCGCSATSGADPFADRRGRQQQSVPLNIKTRRADSTP